MCHLPAFKSFLIRLFLVSLLSVILLTSCLISPETNPLETQEPALTPTFTPLPITQRPVYAPGELVPYTAQSGDTLPNLAFRFNTTISEILEANEVIPDDATTLPPGLPMEIPIYYKALWGSQLQILPNCAFINGPAQIGFDTEVFVNSQPGWLKDFRQVAGVEYRTGVEIVDYLAARFSISPRLLLAILEYQLGALSNPEMPSGVKTGYPLGYRAAGYTGLYLQLVWAANRLNQGYYGWLEGKLGPLEFTDRTIEHPDPWQNGGTVALSYYFSKLQSKGIYYHTLGPEGFIKTYRGLFGDPWNCEVHIPGSLRQPTMSLPFSSGRTWAYTGGPHTGWGQGDPWAAIDFAPPSVSGGCEITSEWAVAVAPGIISRSEPGLVELDLDGDGDSRTGWVMLYLHLGKQDRISLGRQVETGAYLGHPSCEGGESTGSHIHIARKYNGEWIPASGVIPFNLGGWIAGAGSYEYQGTLSRFGEVVTASAMSEDKSLIHAPTPIP